MEKESVQPELLTREQTAQLLGCSARHVDYLRSAGKMPQAVALGKLRRFRRREIMEWISRGCPAVSGG